MSDHESRRTTDHDTIRRWAEARGGRPAAVSDTGEDAADPGVLRIVFGDAPQAQEIGWDAFFERFDAERLAFVYHERPADGTGSRFFEFVGRDR